MASLQQEPTGAFHLVVRIDGRRFKRSLNTKSESKALSQKDEIEETLSLIQRGKISPPENVALIDFLLGKKTKTAKKAKVAHSKADITLSAIFDRFLGSIPAGSLEETTIGSFHIHKRHLVRILGARFKMQNLKTSSLQAYANARSKEPTHYILDKSVGDESKRKNTPVSAATIRKELVSLGTVWRWGVAMELIQGTFPNRGIRLPKLDEKPPFQTWTEIERQTKHETLTTHEVDSLWGCLYLRASEIDKLLEFVKTNANVDYVYPMFAIAAFTGARRSEIIRSRISDFDFDSEVFTIREKKRVKGRHSTRRVPISKKLLVVVKDWISKIENETSFTIAQFNQRTEQRDSVSRDQAQWHFRQTLSNSKWSKIKGWHCLRHSFISNLACAGIDQRIIDDFVGHTTEEMRRRYRHLFPELKNAAINKVFGS